MKHIISYWKNENAVDDALVVKMILIAIAVAAALAIGWYIFNVIDKQTQKQKCDGSANPFCVE